MKKFFGVLAFTTLFILCLASNLALQKQIPTRQNTTNTPLANNGTTLLSCTVVSDSTNTTTKKIFDKTQLVPVEVGVDKNVYFNNEGFIAFKTFNAGGPAYQDTDTRRLGGRGPYLQGELFELRADNLSIIPVTAFPEELNELFTNADPAKSGFVGAGNSWFFFISAQCEECSGPLKQTFIRISEPMSALENIPIPTEYAPTVKVTLGGMEGYAENTNDKTLAQIVGQRDTTILFSLKNKPNLLATYNWATKQWGEVAQIKNETFTDTSPVNVEKIKKTVESDGCAAHEYDTARALLFLPHRLQKPEAKEYGLGGQLLDIYFVDLKGNI